LLRIIVKTKGRNFFQFVFCFESSSKFYFFFGLGLQTVPQRPKVGPTIGQEKLKIGLGFWTLPQSPKEIKKKKAWVWKHYHRSTKPEIEKRSLSILTVPHGQSKRRRN